jgi:hypothetical protein
MSDTQAKYVLAVHPTQRGLGWVLFDAPLSIIDWALSDVSDDITASTLARITTTLTRYSVQEIVMESSGGDHSRRSYRIKSVEAQIERLAHHNCLEFRSIPRSEIERCFSSVTGKTREAIADRIAYLFPELRPRLPPHRKSYMSDDGRMAIFIAASAGIAAFGLKNTESEDLTLTV